MFRNERPECEFLPLRQQFALEILEDVVR